VRAIGASGFRRRLAEMAARRAIESQVDFPLSLEMFSRIQAVRSMQRYGAGEESVEFKLLDPESRAENR
jgi:hypothetical protein